MDMDPGMRPDRDVDRAIEAESIGVIGKVRTKSRGPFQATDWTRREWR
jgi:hypothetical protein